MRNGAYPISQQILVDFVAPPIVAGVFWLMARGWAGSIQLGKVTERSKQRQGLEFWAVLGLGYLLMFGVTIYGCLTQCCTSNQSVALNGEVSHPFRGER
jgi:hypothetical protein